MKKKRERVNFSDIYKLLKDIKIPYIYLVIMVITGFGQSWFRVISPQLTKKLLDGQVNAFTIGLFVFSIFGAIILVSINTLSGTITKGRIQRDISSNIWKKAIKLKSSYLNTNNNKKELISRVSNDTDAFSTFVLVPFDLLPPLLTIFGLVYSFKGYDIMLIYLLVFSVVIKIFFTWLSGQIYFYTAKNVSGRLALLVGKLSNIAESIPVIKIFANENKIRKQGAQCIAENRKYNIFYSLGIGGVACIGSISSLIFTLATIYVGVFLMKSHRIDVSSWMAFAMAQNTFISEAATLITLWTNVKNSNGVVNKIVSIMKEDQEELSNTSDKIRINDDIVFNNVSFGYNDKIVLKNLNFTIPKGKTTAIIGHSGCGKTTILNLLERLYYVSDGEILHGNENVNNIKLDVWRRSISYASQNKDLFDGTIAQNLRYGLNREVSDEELIEVAKKTNSLDFINAKEGKFDAKIGRHGSSLSGGEKQRLTLAREFLKHNDFILFDEATANIDAESEHYIQNALVEVLKDKTAVIVAHRLSTVQNADQIIVMNQGEINGIGNHEWLYENNEIYKNLIDIDFKQKQTN